MNSSLGGKIKRKNKGRGEQGIQNAAVNENSIHNLSL